MENSIDDVTERTILNDDESSVSSCRSDHGKNKVNEKKFKCLEVG